MADLVANISKGRIAYYASLPAANDALRLVLFKASGLVSDATLKDYDDLAAVLAGATDEADFGTYARQTLGSVTVTVDDSGDVVNLDAADPTAYTATGASQAIGKAGIFYDPDTTGGTDADLIPLAFLDCVVTFDVGVATTLSFHASGFAYAS